MRRQRFFILLLKGISLKNAKYKEFTIVWKREEGEKRNIYNPFCIITKGKKDEGEVRKEM